MLEKRHNVERDHNKEGSSLCPNTQIYSLEAVMALQKALENGIPSQLADSPPHPPKNDWVSYRTAQLPSPPRLDPALQRTRHALIRILRGLFAGMKKSERVSASGRSAQEIA
jgi:hypothetical protein